MSDTLKLSRDSWADITEEEQGSSSSLDTQPIKRSIFAAPMQRPTFMVGSTYNDKDDERENKIVKKKFISSAATPTTSTSTSSNSSNQQDIVSDTSRKDQGRNQNGQGKGNHFLCWFHRNNDHNHENCPNYKTKMCQFWMRKGECRMYQYCFNAHGAKELKTAPRFSRCGNSRASIVEKDENDDRKWDRSTWGQK